jgi:hypothetical protein
MGYCPDRQQGHVTSVEEERSRAALMRVVLAVVKASGSDALILSSMSAVNSRSSV